MTHIRKFGRSVKRLNLFKVTNQRTEKDIKQQKISTRVYLALLTGMFTFSAYISASINQGRSSLFKAEGVTYNAIVL